MSKCAERSVTMTLAAALLAVSCGGSDGGSAGAQGGAGAGASAGGSGGSAAAATGGSGAGSASGGAPATGGSVSGTGAVASTGGTGGTGGGAAGAGGRPSGGGGGTGSAGAPATGGTGNVPTSTCIAPQPAATVGNACSGAPPPALKLTELASQLDAPVFATHAPGDATRLFIVERAGVIRVFESGALSPTPFLDIQGVVRSPGPVGEQGLLGLAFDPDYEQTGRFFVNYTAETGNGDTVVAAYAGVPGQPADPTSGVPLFSVVQPSFLGNHNGGMLAFGPDGCLYVGMGDGGDGDDPGGNGQNRGTQLGALLRVDVDGYPNAAPGNPQSPGADPHVWSWGLRNPWRFSFDRGTGDLYIGDVGQGAWEEVDVEPRGRGNVNYGWNVMEGMHCRVGSTCDRTGLTEPAVEQDNTTHKAVVGGYVYRGSNIPGLVGRYVYGDYASRRMWSFVYSGEASGQPQVCDTYDLSISPDGDITSFGEDAAGELYVLTLQGKLFRIDPA